MIYKRKTTLGKYELNETFIGELEDVLKCVHSTNENSLDLGTHDNVHDVDCPMFSPMTGECARTKLGGCVIGSKNCYMEKHI